MRKFEQIAALATALAITATSPALAIQADAMIDQVEVPLRAASWQMDQLTARTTGSSFIAQVELAPASADLSLQAAVERVPFADAALAVQLSPQLNSRGSGAELAFLGLGIDLGPFRRAGEGSSSRIDADRNEQRFAWNGDDNLQASWQVGTNNRSMQQQLGSFNASLVFQTGELNLAETTQTADASFAAILQSGKSNQATIHQGTDASVAIISQSGTGNVALVRQ